MNAPEPLTTKLPESSWSPGFLVTGSISPVSSDSIDLHARPVGVDLAIHHDPVARPDEDPVIQDDVLRPQRGFRPVRTTRTGSSPSTARRSSVRLARSSWITPMPVFATMTRPNRASCGCPVTSTTAARAPTMALNLVSTFARMMSDTGLLVRLPVSFDSPAATRSATCALVSPLCCGWVSTHPPSAGSSASILASAPPAGRSAAHWRGEAASEAPRRPTGSWSRRGRFAWVRGGQIRLVVAPGPRAGHACRGVSRQARGRGGAAVLRVVGRRAYWRRRRWPGRWLGPSRSSGSAR